MTSFEDEINKLSGCVYGNVEGAPFRIGQWVQFVGRADNSITNQGVGRVGKIAAFYYSGISGEKFPNDPFILIHDLPHDMYWQEELRALSEEEAAQIVEVNVPVLRKVLQPITEIVIEKHFELPSSINSEV